MRWAKVQGTCQSTPRHRLHKNGFACLSVEFGGGGLASGWQIRLGWHTGMGPSLGTRTSAGKTGKTISARRMCNSGYVWERGDGAGEQGYNNSLAWHWTRDVRSMQGLHLGVLWLAEVKEGRERIGMLPGSASVMVASGSSVGGRAGVEHKPQRKGMHSLEEGELFEAAAWR